MSFETTQELMETTWCDGYLCENVLLAQHLKRDCPKQYIWRRLISLDHNQVPIFLQYVYGYCLTCNKKTCHAVMLHDIYCLECPTDRMIEYVTGVNPSTT